MSSISNINGKIHIHNVNYAMLSDNDKLTLAYAKYNYSYLNSVDSHISFDILIANIVNYAYLNKVTRQVLVVLRKCIDVS